MSNDSFDEAWRNLRVALIGFQKASDRAWRDRMMREIDLHGAIDYMQAMAKIQNALLMAYEATAANGPNMTVLLEGRELAEPSPDGFAFYRDAVPPVLG